MEMLDTIRTVLGMLTPYLPGLVSGLVILALVLISVLLFIIHRQRKAAAEAEDTEGGEAEAGLAREPNYDAFQAEPDDLPLLPMRQSFRYALRLLRNHVAGRDWLYAIPWYLLIGPEKSGKSTLIAHAGMEMPIGQPASDLEDLRPACKWWFFDRGVVLDVAGILVRQNDGRGSNATAWKKFLGLLDRYRPRRPADGIILTVPLEDFLDDTGAVRPIEDIVQRAEGVYKKLWQAQARLGLAFPIYVIVTKSDRLPGFKTFVGSLPDHALADMVGWASPYGFESEFREPWIDEAVDAVSAAYQQIQMELFTRDIAPDVAEDIFAFPTAFEGLRDPLRLYFRQVFKPSVYHDAFSLRGIWFTGDSGLEDAHEDRSSGVLSGVYSGPRAREPYPVFLQDLFETKVFPERNAARPIKRALLSRNRMVTAMQGTAAGILLFGGAVLAWTHSSLQHDVNTVQPFIIEVEDDAREVSLTNSGTGLSGSAGSFNKERALSLLKGMADLETGSFSSIFIPTSWFEDIDDRVVDVTTDAFNLFILRTMGSALGQRGEAISEGRLPQERLGGSVFGGGVSGLLEDVSDASIPREPGPEYALLRRYIEATRDFEAAVARYNPLRETDDLESVAALVSYLFGVTLPSSFLENTAFYEKALGGADYQEVPLEIYQPRIIAEYQRLADQAITALYSENPLLLEIQGLAIALDDAATRRSAGYEVLMDLRSRLDRVQDLLVDPRFSWVNDPAFDPTIAYAALTERIGGSQLLGPAQAGRFSNAHAEELKALRLALSSVRSTLFGPVLDQEDPLSSLRLAPELIDAKQVMDLLAVQPFMREGRYRPLPDTPSIGAAVRWNAEALEDASTLVADYDTFIRDELPTSPRSLWSLIRTAGAERLEIMVNDRIAGSLDTSRTRVRSSVDSEEALGQSVEQFALASPYLVSLISAYDDLGREDSYLDLLDIAAGGAFVLLEDADALFNAEPLYTPRGGDFGWWQGRPGAALEAFRARDVFELGDVLDRQRGRISLIATSYVRPLTDFLNDMDIRLSDREVGLLSKWQRILTEVTKFNLQQADNTVSELERFITGPLMDVRFAGCVDTLGSSNLEGRSADFFLARITRLARTVRDRCLELAGIEAQTAYNAIADSFADTLSGRFPFTEGPYSGEAREASPAELIRFFQVYDRNVANARTALEQAEDLGLSRDRALAFLTRMDRARAVFDPWLSATSGDDTPVFDLAASFRVNRTRERGANQVIDWSLSSGADTTGLRQPGEGGLRWSLGDPISVELRWAADSIEVPAASARDQSARVAGRAVSLTYDNAWALFALLAQHRTSSEDFVDRIDPRPHTLRVVQPTRPADGGNIDSARLYFRVEIFAQQDGEAVPIIVSPFPFDAPLLEP